VICDLLGKIGISRESIVVIVNKNDTDWNRADATRVAWTCIVAGVVNTSILDGGFNRWRRMNPPIISETVLKQFAPYNCQADRSTLILKKDVAQNIGHSILLDTRLPEDYFGISQSKGHIPSALNLPAPWAYYPDGKFRDVEFLKAMVTSMIGKNENAEIIEYCEVGGFASTWWFILHQVLGYKNVKIFDGSFQEWLLDSKAPVTSFRWD
jgi:thiosulfate/3-mercaptopyruvate sulfurtransferase